MQIQLIQADMIHSSITHGGSISESPINSYDSGVWDYMRTHYEDYKFFGIYSEKDDDYYYYY